jgi:hypothetical protein
VAVRGRQVQLLLVVMQQVAVLGLQVQLLLM